MKVLIVEDMPDQAFVVKRMLKHIGVESTTCFDPFEAIELVRMNECDVVVTDVAMPIMDGIEMTRRIREFSEIPIVIITSYVEDVDRMRCFQAGASYFLTKPIMVSDLKHVFEQWL